ncbi:ammonium transporter [Rhodococcus sp. NPDC058521]|uniref:ammonium transporter n=1 Tax=Rhodococcus sp. NPDC058521 TaxID=3346536 RepID=UPI00365F7C63
MKLRKFAAVATMMVASMGVAAGTSYAAPAPAPEQPGINYESKIEDKSVVTTIDAGAFKVAGNGESFEIKDNNGNTVVSLPLAVQLDGLEFPLEEKISEDGRTLTLTPETDPAKATPVAPKDRIEGIALKDVASPEENLVAQQTFGAQLGIATATGGLVGTIIGCVAGGLIGIPAAVVPGFLGGCAAGAGVGAVVGTIVVGGPALIAAGIGLGQTLLAEPGTTVYAK